MTPEQFAQVTTFLIELYVWLSIFFLGYILKVQLSRVALADWLKASWHTLVLSYVFGALVCVALVISPNAASALGQLGYNAEQGMFSLALAISGLTIGVANWLEKKAG